MKPRILEKMVGITSHGPIVFRRPSRAGKHALHHISGNMCNLRTIQSANPKRYETSALTNSHCERKQENTSSKLNIFVNIFHGFAMFRKQVPQMGHSF